MQTLITKATKKLQRGKEKLWKKIEDEKVNKFMNNRQQSDWPHKIYHYHIRKTGGTTINYAFLSNAGEDNLEVFYEKMARKYYHRMIANEKIFVGWNIDLINEGQYSFAFSHTPAHRLNIPKDVIKITCLRDPLKRVLSHYNMLKYYLVNNIDHACVVTEGKWVGNSLHDFLDNIPKRHLLNQMYMFSEKFDTKEAVERIRQCYACLFTESLEQDLDKLSKDLGILLPITHQKKYHHKEEIGQDALDRLREMLDPEYRMIEQLGVSPK